MSHEDVIKMLREVGVPWQNNEMISIYVLQRFAALVAAAEREACAQICDEHADDPVYCGQAIRARGNT